LADPNGLKGKSDFDLFTEEHSRPAYEDEQRIIQTGEPLIGKLEKETHMDGHVTWALTTKMPWRDSNGNIIGTFGISKDVTAMKETEDQFAETSSLLETLLANSPDCIYFKDAQSRFVRFSKSFAALFHIANAEELKGKAISISSPKNTPGRPTKTNRRSFAPASRSLASWRRKPIPMATSPGL